MLIVRCGFFSVVKGEDPSSDTCGTLLQKVGCCIFQPWPNAYGNRCTGL